VTARGWDALEESCSVFVIPEESHLVKIILDLNFLVGIWNLNFAILKN
jgi:hypothetical protein